MRALLPLFLVMGMGVGGVAGGCQSTPAPAEETAKPESRATAMPASLRCQRAADCQPEATCYWSTPACVAVATAVTQKCEDADPEDKSREKFTCGCQEGQCVAVTQ